jgi:predicted nucleotidyltransferase
MQKLNEKIWGKDNRIIPEVKDKLLVIAHKVANEVATLVEIKNIYFTGSLASYKWTAASDIDVHIIVKVLENHTHNTLAEYFDLICKLFNSHHNIFIKGYKVEVNMKDKEVFHKDKAVYDLIKDEWVQEPNPKTRNLNDPEVIKIAKDVEKKIDRLIRSKRSAEEAKELKKEIKEFRKSGLESDEGEYSIGNLVFKKLRGSGYIAKIFNYFNEVEDASLSLEKTSFKKYLSIS